MLGGTAAAWPLAAHAQQSEGKRRIGVLMGYPEDDPQAQANVTVLRQGLHDLSWIEGRNVQIEYRWAGGDSDKARTFARELIGMTPDVMAVASSRAWHGPAGTSPDSPILRIRSEANGLSYSKRSHPAPDTSDSSSIRTQPPMWVSSTPLKPPLRRSR